MPLTRRFPAVSLGYACWLLMGLPARAPGASTVAPEPGRGWLRGLDLVVLDSQDDRSLQHARGVIQDRGGRIALMCPPSTLAGWIPSELHAELVGQAHIAAIYDSAVDDRQLAAWDPATRAMATWYNEAVTGRYEARMASEIQQAPPPLPEDLRSDVLAHQPRDADGFLRNLQAQGLDVGRLQKQGLLTLDKGNSDTMAGTVAVTVFFVESTGTGTDPNLYTWTPQAVQDYIAGVNTGLAWWTTKAAQFSDCWVAFLVRYNPPTDPRCGQWREMALHPSGDVGGMVSDVMANFGYASGNHLTRVDAFNTSERLLRGTDRSYSAFVAYNPLPATDQLTDGLSAFAYLLGPYSFLLYRSYSWRPDQVFTHESGHIFGACDEYADGCACAGACSNGIPNQNCEDCSLSSPCMMKYNSFALCPYTDGHVGWRYSPCAPPPLPAPALLSLSPAAGLVGTTFDVTATGDNFVWGAMLDLGADVKVNSTTVIDSHTMSASITLASVAAPGLRGAAVINRDLQASPILSGAFDVLPTPRHYVAVSGSGTFPYLTPQTAAPTLADALTAAGPGDSVLVEAGVIHLMDLQIPRPVHLIGGWSAGFLTQGDGGARTTLDLTTSIRVSSGATVEDFEILNGAGRQVFTPAEGRWGGALANDAGTLTLIGCQLHANAALFPTTQIGQGGAVRAANSTVVLRDCVIQDNRAYQGGGLYLENCSAVIERTTFVHNTVTEDLIGGERGGALYALNCPSIVLADVVFDHNRSLAEGGAVFLSGCGNVQVSGGSLLANQSGAQGGGMDVRGSTVTIDGMLVQGNVATSSGGGLVADPTTQLTLRSSTLSGNAALLGAAVAATGGTIHLEHNLFVAQQAAATGSAAYLNGVAAGRVLGNTLDANLCGAAGGAALLLVNAPLPVFDNLVVRSDKVGITCAGSPTPTLHHNLVWGSTTADYGSCAAGAGSLSADPRFVNAAAGDYHLALNSPAIDAGDPDPQFADADGSRGDLGWLGSSSRPLDQPARPQGLFAITSAAGARVRWEPNAEPDLAQYALYGSATSGFVPSPANQLALLPAGTVVVDQSFPGAPQYFRLSAVDASGYASGFSNEAVLSPVAVLPVPPVLTTRLHQNVPNPFNPSTTIRFTLRERVAVQLTIYDAMGGRVRTLLDEVQAAGAHEAVWDGTDDQGRAAASGVYFYCLRAGGFAATQRMVLLK